MTLSAQNTILPHLGADIRPQPERRREPKWIMTDDGEWVSRDHVLARDGRGGWIEFPEIERTE